MSNFSKYFKTPNYKQENLFKKHIDLFANKKLRLIAIFRIIFIVSLICLLKPCNTQGELAANLQIEFSKISKNFPDGWNLYFQNIVSMGQIKLDEFDVNETEYRLRKIHRFNEDVISNFQTIIYEEYTIYKTFSFSISTYFSEYREFIGAARITNNNRVQFGYIEINTFSELILLYKLIPTKKCETFLFLFQKCHYYDNYIPRGYRMDELELISQTLKAHSYKHLLLRTQNVLIALQSKQFVLSENSPYYSDDGKYFLQMQRDGNLVIFEKDLITDEIKENKIWESGTKNIGIQPFLLVIEHDGELVIYDG